MKISTIVLAITSLVLMAIAMVDAAAIKKDDNAQKNENKENEKSIFKSDRNSSPYILSASEERFTSCGNPNKDALRITSITSTRHLCPGCNACISLTGQLKERIEEGATIQIQVSKFITVLDKTFDLCSALEAMPDGPRCPIEPTAISLRACFSLNKSFPQDTTADVRITASTATGKSLFCIKGTGMIESHCPKDVGPGTYACNH
ncbi:hypothetical protein EDD21DRAFT_439397 [Dissophora ornata]|nr:hypothetical protein BGZ58_000994 [Dissophora ornata]KAI8606519.1 hypothetical protein EDD21DRAFT_439397 [Dissophora ornata]